MSLTYGELCAGVGGLSLGLEKAGLQCRWLVEKDPDCQRVLKRHWPTVPLYGDVTAVNWSEVEPADCIAAGFPCQPYALCGKRRQQNDERYLWPEVAKALRILRPKYAILENVPGLLLSPAFGAVLRDLAELGYDAQWSLLSASGRGAPHLRRRLFVFAHPSCDRRGAFFRPLDPEEGDLEVGGAADGAATWNGLQLEGPGTIAERAIRAFPQPIFQRMAPGLPGRLDKRRVLTRLRQVGNSVCPAVAEHLGRLVVRWDKGERGTPLRLRRERVIL